MALALRMTGVQVKNFATYRRGRPRCLDLFQFRRILSLRDPRGLLVDYITR